VEDDDVAFSWDWHPCRFRELSFFFVGALRQSIFFWKSLQIESSAVVSNVVLHRFSQIIAHNIISKHHRVSFLVRPSVLHLKVNEILLLLAQNWYCSKHHAKP
jgi:hypothetical protein